MIHHHKKKAVFIQSFNVKSSLALKEHVKSWSQHRDVRQLHYSRKWYDKTTRTDGTFFKNGICVVTAGLPKLSDPTGLYACTTLGLSRGVAHIVLEQLDFACSLRSERVGVSHDLEQKMLELCVWPFSTR